MALIKKELTVVMSADTAHFYYRIAHHVTDLSFQSFGIGLEYVMLLFGTIQSLKIFLRSKFGL